MSLRPEYPLTTPFTAAPKYSGIDLHILLQAIEKEIRKDTDRGLPLSSVTLPLPPELNPADYSSEQHPIYKLMAARYRGAGWRKVTWDLLRDQPGPHPTQLYLEFHI